MSNICNSTKHMVGRVTKIACFTAFCSMVVKGFFLSTPKLSRRDYYYYLTRTCDGHENWKVVKEGPHRWNILHVSIDAASSLPKEQADGQPLERCTEELISQPVGQLHKGRVRTMIQSWSNMRTAYGVQMVDRILERLEKEIVVGRNTHVALDRELFNMAIDAWANSGDRRGPTRAEQILQRMEELSTNHPNLQPDICTFNTVINAWAKSKTNVHKSASRAEQILTHLERRCDETMGRAQQLLKPNTITYTTVMKTLAKCAGQGVDHPIALANKAEMLLRSMVQRYMDGERNVKPNIVSFNTVIDAAARVGDAERAERLLKLLDYLYRQYGNLDLQPNVHVYTTVINAWARSTARGSASRAEEILRDMIHRSANNGEPHLKPTTITYNTVLHALAQRGTPNTAERAEALLKYMVNSYLEGDQDVQPDSISFNSVIDAWGNCRDSTAPHRAEEILQYMERTMSQTARMFHKEGNNPIQPNVYVYNTLLKAWARSMDKGSADRVEEILWDMQRQYKEEGKYHLKPNTVTYNTVIHALAKSGKPGAAERVERILLHMMDSYKRGEVDCKPDKISFNAVIDAWARSKDCTAPSKAERILRCMEELYHLGNSDLQPDLYTYNAVLNSWAKIGSASQAEQFLAGIELHGRQHADCNKSLRPDTVSYNIVVHALARSGEPDAAKRAETILYRMLERYKNGDTTARPDTITFNAVIDAWANSRERGAAPRAERILQFMHKQYKDEGRVHIKPDAHTYTIVMKACALTKDEEDKEEARKLAFRIFKHFTAQKGMHPNSYTYTTLLSVCDNLIPKADEELRFFLSTVVFERCREAGYVNDYVLSKLRKTITQSQYIRLVGSLETNIRDLPSKWTSKVHSTKLRWKNS